MTATINGKPTPQAADIVKPPNAADYQRTLRIPGLALNAGNANNAVVCIKVRGSPAYLGFGRLQQRRHTHKHVQIHTRGLCGYDGFCGSVGRQGRRAMQPGRREPAPLSGDNASRSRELASALLCSCGVST